MRPAPINDRIVAALALSPMTIRKLSIVLSSSTHTLRDRIDVMRREGVVEKCGVEESRGRPWNIYRVAA